MAVVPAARWAHCANSRGVGGVHGRDAQVGAHDRRQRFAGGDGRLGLAKRRPPAAAPRATSRRGGPAPLEGGRLASVAMSPIRTLPARAPRRRRACSWPPQRPPRVAGRGDGIRPIRRADVPRCGSRVKSGTCGAPARTRRDVVVVGAGALEPLHVPAVGEHDLGAGEERHPQSGTPSLTQPLAVDHRHEAGRHVLGVAGAGAEVPRPGQPVAAVDGVARPFGKNWPPSVTRLPLAAKTSAKPSSGR